MASKPVASPTNTGNFVHHDKPWLLSSNRRLRNLASISLRNLSLTLPSTTNRRVHASDDDALPNTHISPSKSISLRESAGLTHSRSSTQLHTLNENAVVEADCEATVHPVENFRLGQKQSHGSPRASPRPRNARTRRRSTLEWISATPQRRQERLERMIAEQMGDVFYSLHIDDIQEPIYISETQSNTMNPTFMHMDLSLCSPGVTRMNRVLLLVWTKSVKSKRWTQLLEMPINFRDLQYLGKSLVHLRQKLPQNAVLLHLPDGIYIPFQCLITFAPTLPTTLTRKESTRYLGTATFDALLRLSKLDDSIQDALAIRSRIAARLESFVASNQQALVERDQVAAAKDRLRTIDFAKKTVVKQLEKGRKQQEEKRTSLLARKRLIAEDLQRRGSDREVMLKSRPEIPALYGERAIRKTSIHNQRRRVCEDVQKCYPILPVPKESLAFTLRGLPLPNSEDFDNATPDETAAALGHAAHLTLLLSFYLDQPLPYVLTCQGSTSTIFDPISILTTNASLTKIYKDEKSLRTYPLFSKGVPRFRFDYGVFLLNKNIQILLENAYNVRVMDVRQTLPNLKYLLYVATAGEGELPTRKAGGVKGLLSARTESSVGINGMLLDSTDPDSNSNGDSKLHINDRPRGAVRSLRQNMAGIAAQEKRRAWA